MYTILQTWLVNYVRICSLPSKNSRLFVIFCLTVDHFTVAYSSLTLDCSIFLHLTLDKQLDRGRSLEYREYWSATPLPQFQQYRTRFIT